MHGRAKPAVFTTVPEQDVRPMLCPLCIHPLLYHHSVFGGVQSPERWDYYYCRDCEATFQYRHRTHRLTVTNDKL